MRRYAQGRAYQLLHDTGPGPYDAPSVQRVLAGIATQLGALRHEAAE
jgi:hypothetical protein